MKKFIFYPIAFLLSLVCFPAWAEMTGGQAMTLYTVAITSDPSARNAEDQLRAAAENGDPWANQFMGLVIETKNFPYTPTLAKEAFKFFRKAADAGLPEGADNLGNSYMKGDGVKRNTSEAAKWYKRAIDGYLNRDLASGCTSGASIPSNQTNSYPSATGGYQQPMQDQAQQVMQSQQQPVDFCSQAGTSKIIQVIEETNPGMSGAGLVQAVKKVHQMYGCGG